MRRSEAHGSRTWAGMKLGRRACPPPARILNPYFCGGCRTWHLGTLRRGPEELEAVQGSAKATVYISSTYEDLKQYRHEVTGALRKINVDVIGMEDYGAESRRPLQRCLEDVRRADVYLGFLAWRYG